MLPGHTFCTSKFTSDILRNSVAAMAFSVEIEVWKGEYPSVFAMAYISMTMIKLVDGSQLATKCIFSQSVNLDWPCYERVT